MTLFVGHLTEKIKDAALRELFEPYGTIVSIDRKGTYAFIEYDSTADTSRVVRDLHKKEVHGTVLRVELSNRKRGESGPAPGDLAETCYNCQQIGHIAKNCPLPTQPAQMQHLHRIHPQQRRNPLYSQYELATGSSSQFREITQSARPAKREGFLDQNPQKIRLVEHGNQRMRINPYAHFMGSDGGSGSWSKSRGKSKNRPSTSQNTAYHHPHTVPSTHGQNTSAGSPLSEGVSFEALYTSGMQTMLSSGVMKMADELPLSSMPHYGYTSPSYLRPDDSTSPTIVSPIGNHPHIPAPGTPTIEHPYLPPGTLVYLPAVTVLPSGSSQSPSQPYNARTHTSSASLSPHLHTAMYAPHMAGQRPGLELPSPVFPNRTHALVGNNPLNIPPIARQQLYSACRPPPPPPPISLAFPPQPRVPQPLAQRKQQCVHDKHSRSCEGDAAAESCKAGAASPVLESKPGHKASEQTDSAYSATFKTEGLNIMLPATDTHAKDKDSTVATRSKETSTD